MNALGTQVHANRVLFDQLTQSIGGQDEVLSSLRQSTSGVVDDLTLMSGASQLLRLNIVDSSADLNHLYSNIVKLKSPTEDTTDAIQNFALMLSNESMLRLDSFGISSANVKKAMDELGISFREAVMMEMDKQVERLGDAADVAATKVGKLQTIWTNFTNGLGEFVNQHAEEIAGGLLGELPEQIGTRLLQQQGINPSDFRGWSDYQQAALDAAEQYGRSQKLIQSGFNQMSAAVAEYTRLEHQAATQSQRDAETHAQFLKLIGFPSDSMVSPGDVFNTDAITRGLDRFSVLSMNRGSLGDQLLFTEADASRARTMADSMDHMVELLGDGKALVEGGFLTQADVDRVKDTAKAADDLAKNVEKGADAFERMSLSQALGLGASPLDSDLSNMFMNAAQSIGLTADQLERYQNALDIADGSQTTFSLGLQDYMEQLAGSGASADEIAQRIQNLSGFLAQAKLQGLDTTNLLPGNLDLYSGGTGLGGGRNIHVNSGDNLYSLADRYGGNPEDYRSIMQGRFLQPGDFNMGGGSALDPNFDPSAMVQTLIEGTDTAANSFTSMVDDSVTMNDNFNTIKQTVEDIFSTKYTLKLDAIAPDWLKALLSGAGGDAFAKAMAEATRGNGGVAPGTQPQGHSSRLIDP